MCDPGQQRPRALARAVNQVGRLDVKDCRVDDRDLQEWELPEPDDEAEADSSTATIRCPGCGAAIYEESVQCPYCGDYVTPDAAVGLAGRPWWFVVMAVAAILAVMTWLLF
jgi:DNA-directed RNA polymerase subunit RPC12/RpoP